jgi:hypothetical protein
MATGMFRTGDGYEENGYKPDFDELPLEADYWAAQEKEKSSEAKNTMTVIK